MTDYTTNYMSNSARMIGFAIGGTQMHLDNMKFAISIENLPRATRDALLYSIDCLEKKQEVIELWWEKRDQEGVTVDGLLAEIRKGA